MNLAEIVKEAKELPFGDDLETIFKLQNEIDYVNSSVYNRKLTKKIGYDVVHSLNASYHIYVSMHNLSLKAEKVDSVQKDLLHSFNYEIAKSLNSIIRLLSSSNVGYDDVKNYYQTLLTELKIADVYFFKDNLMQTCMQYARYNNIMNMLYNNPDISLRPVVISGPVPDEFLRGGRILNRVYLELMRKYYWEFTSQLFLALNKLPTDIEKHFDVYQNQLMEAWLHYFAILDFLSYNHDSVGRLYSILYHIKTNNHEKNS